MSAIGVAALAAAFILIVYHRKIVEEWHFFRTRRSEWYAKMWKNWGEPFVVAAVLAVLIRTFLLGPYKIPTGSMRPTFLEGDRIFVDKISYRFGELKRGDIVVFKYPEEPKKDFVKRLAGLPGDRIEIRDGKLVINGGEMNRAPFSKNYYYNNNEWPYGKEGQVIVVPDQEYFVLGDNSAASLDSRKWGFVPQKNLVGRAFFIWWPPKRVQLS